MRRHERGRHTCFLTCACVCVCVCRCGIPHQHDITQHCQVTSAPILTNPTPCVFSLQGMDAFESEAVENDDDDIVFDITQPSPRQGPAAVARQLDKMMSFLSDLMDVADELQADVESVQVSENVRERGDETKTNFGAMWESLHSVQLRCGRQMWRWC